MNQVLTWCLNEPKFLAVIAGFVVALWTAIRKAREGKATRDALDLVNNELRGMGFTKPAVMLVAADALQARSRRKALLELGKSDVRLSTDDTTAWVREQVKQMKEKKR